MQQRSPLLRTTLALAGIAGVACATAAAQARAETC